MFGVTNLLLIMLFLLTDQILCSNDRKDLYCGGMINSIYCISQVVLCKLQLMSS